MAIFYKPDDANIGDVIPYYHNGEYYLFYIYSRPNTAPPWYLLTTSDFVSFKEHGLAIPCGGVDDQDADIWTGSVREADGKFHIFYTGHNNSYRAKELPEQVVMHTTSDDLITWTKDPSFALPPIEEEGFERYDWRDPFVFYNDEAGKYWMIITARDATVAASRRRGCLVVLSSSDLKAWRYEYKIWAPEECDTQECPDMFKIGEWWYLVFSSYRGEWKTEYRMSKSPYGPWISPELNTFDGGAFYAAKTAGTEPRMIIGWLPSRTDNKDSGPLGWGGKIVAHEIHQQPDGVLTASIPSSIASKFTKKCELAASVSVGNWQISENKFAADSTNRFSLLELGSTPSTCYIETTFRYEPATSKLGLMLRADDPYDNYYQLIVEPSRQRMRFVRDDSTPGQFLFVQERQLDIQPNRPIKLRILIDESVIVIYVDDKVAMSGRMHDLDSGKLALFVGEGKCEFTDTSVRVLEADSC